MMVGAPSANVDIVGEPNCAEELHPQANIMVRCLCELKRRNRALTPRCVLIVVYEWSLAWDDVIESLTEL
jgi:hypothetical protein